jgi:hypothetical protein
VITLRRILGAALTIIVVYGGVKVLLDIKRLTDIQSCGVNASCTNDGVVVVTFRPRQGDQELARIAPYLKAMSRRVGLQMPKCQVTDTGLASLKGLNNVYLLRLEHDKITDACVDSLSTMSGLVSLVLTGTQVTDGGIKKLKLALPDLYIEKLPPAQGVALQQIQNPRIDRTSKVVSDGTWSDADGGLIGARLKMATDTDLRRLKGHLEQFKQSLEELSLSGEGVTDAGLTCLKGLSHLRRLTLTGTSVTDTGVRQLRQALPQLEVSR